jgi:hypothetical protein
MSGRHETRGFPTMNRKIPNKPHPTPDPEKSHSGRSDRSNLARAIPGVPATTEHVASEWRDPATEEPNYDSCFDHINMVLSQSMEQPDPDPNLASSGEATRQPDGTSAKPGSAPAKRGGPPRTSEIFRSVMAPLGDTPTSAGSIPSAPAGGETVDPNAVPDIGVLDRRTESTDSHVSDDSHHDGNIPWGHILLLTYSSVLTLVLIWLFWTGRIPKSAPPETPPTATEKTAPEPAVRHVELRPATPPPPIPPENITTLRKPVRLGDLEVTPRSIEAGPVALVHRIDANERRSEDDCLVLRLRLTNLSKNQTFTPIDPVQVRERDIRTFDPYIATSEGRPIRLFPLALDSEWSLFGQEFPVLAPNESAETFIAAEPGSADHLADEMTWRVRVRFGPYRSDMIGVRFTKSDVRRRLSHPWADEE